MNIDIKQVAELAKLSINDKDVPALEEQIKDILKKINTLPDGLEEKYELKEENKMRLREDKPEDSISREALLANAPQKQAGCIVVPKIV